MDNVQKEENEFNIEENSKKPEEKTCSCCSECTGNSDCTCECENCSCCVQEDKKKLLILLILLIFGIILLGGTLGITLMGSRTVNNQNTINVGSILFSFSEESNNIEIKNAYPISDDIGMNLSSSKEYFDFTVSVGFNKPIKQSITYEISIIPLEGNTIEPQHIRVYLTENGNPVLINNNKVNNYTDLEDSKLQTNSKVLYRKTVENNEMNRYVFRMWLGRSYDVDNINRIFKCKIGVDTFQ